MLEWIIISGLVVAIYIILYRYEKKMNMMQKHIDEHKDKIDKHHKKLDEHHNYIEEMWVTIPKRPNEKKNK